jgi:hypothetical protein
MYGIIKEKDLVKQFKMPEDANEFFDNYDKEEHEGNIYLVEIKGVK